MVPSFSIVSAAIEQSFKAKSWRDDIRQRVGGNNELLNQILVDLAQGKAWRATITEPDGTTRLSAPVVPSSDVRLRAAMFLSEMNLGKAVAQTEVLKSEQEARELNAIRALSDDELNSALLKAAQERKLLPQNSTVDAEFVAAEPVDAEKLALEVWCAPATREEKEDEVSGNKVPPQAKVRV